MLGTAVYCLLYTALSGEAESPIEAALWAVVNVLPWLIAFEAAKRSGTAARTLPAADDRVATDHRGSTRLAQPIFHLQARYPPDSRSLSVISVESSAIAAVAEQPDLTLMAHATNVA